MFTVRAGSAAIGLCLLMLVSGCSREQQDWRSAEAADTIEAYGQFIQQHPESELTVQARTRVAQLGEDRDWQRAGSADTVDAYREFVAQHPNGKWAQEAHIRIENFSLGEQNGTDAGSHATAALANHGSAGVAATPNASGSGSSSLATPPGTGDSGPGSAAAIHGASGQGPSGASASAAGAADAARSYGLADPGEVASSAGSLTPAQPQPQTQGAFGIQLGAFSTEAAAVAQWQALTVRFGPELQSLHEHVVPASAASGRVYRLQATVDEESRARAICESLRKHGQACVAVLPH